jgi:mono/diheme cytochrome c family protein
MVKNGDPSHGKALFETTCGGCHTLADANTKGTVGPNLDDAFSSDKQQGFTIQSIEDVVRGQIAYPDPSGPMKPNLVKGQDANDVATYIAKCSGNPSCGVTPTRPAPPSTSASTPTTTTKAPSSSPLAAGKQVFETAGCTSCHTLKDAGATGTVGPNLDQLKPAEAIVVRQVTNGGKIMPAFKGRLSPTQIQAVAKYVSSVAGKG